jgi:hypothetical protein
MIMFYDTEGDIFLFYLTQDLPSHSKLMLILKYLIDEEYKISAKF